MANESKKLGRPAKPATQKRAHCVSVWLTEGEKAEVVQAAGEARDSAGHWLGTVGVEAARRVLRSSGRATRQKKSTGQE